MLWNYTKFISSEMLSLTVSYHKIKLYLSICTYMINLYQLIVLAVFY